MAPISEKAACAMITDILKTQDVNARIKKTDDFMKRVWKGQVLQSKRLDAVFDDLIAQCLQDCLRSKKRDPGMKLLLKLPFSANQQKRFLNSAVAVFLQAGKLRQALQWIDEVADVFGKKAVLHLAKQDEFKRLHEQAKFKKIVGPGAELERLKENLGEMMEMWKKDGYDNIKDAVLEAQELIKRAQRLKSPVLEKARQHYAVVVKEARRMMNDDPEIKKYLKGIL